MVLVIASLLAAAPIHVEKLGFSVTVRDEQVIVSAVAPGGPADKGKLRVGDVLTRLVQPQWLFGHGPLARLSETDLHDVLTPPVGEPLVVSVKRADGTGGLVQVQREEPALDPLVEFAQPLSAEQQRRLSVHQQSRYAWAQAHRVQAAIEARRDKLPLVEFAENDAPRVAVDHGRVVPGERAAVSPDWVYFTGTFTLRCPNSAPGPVKIVLDGPVPARFEQPRDKAAFTNVELALWRVRDVAASCAGSVPTNVKPARVRVSTQCQGETKVREVALDVPLERTCGPAPDPRTAERWGVLIFNDALVVGAPGPRVDLTWDMMRPRPTEATLVEVDEKGAVAKRLQTVNAPATGSSERQTLAAPVDTTSARTVRVGVELLFADGSRDVVAGKPVEIITAAEDAKRSAQFRKDSARALEVMDALLKRGDPCSDIPATLEWLRKQPGVASADSAPGGHDLSFWVGRAPQLFVCHAGY